MRKIQRHNHDWNNKLQFKPYEQINFVSNSILMPAFFCGNLLSANFQVWEIKLAMKFIPDLLTLTVWAVNSWTHNFNLTQDQLKKVLPLPHEVEFEPYLKAFQYKVLNSILFTNKKLCKIGYIQDDKCSLCKRIRNPFTTSFSNVDTPSSFGSIDKRIHLPDLTRRYYRNIIYKLPFTELFDTDR